VHVGLVSDLDHPVERRPANLVAASRARSRSGRRPSGESSSVGPKGTTMCGPMAARSMRHSSADSSIDFPASFARLRSPDDLTTEEAAAVLGVPRPTVVRLIDAGKLPARMVGTHRRLSLDRMTRQAEDLGLYH